MPLLSPPDPHTLNDLAELLGAEVVGDGDFTVTAIAHPVFARHRETLALAMDKGSHALLDRTHAGAAIVARGMEIDADRFAGGLTIGSGFRVALARLTQLLSPALHFLPGVHPSAVVDPAANIHDGASVGPLCVVGPEATVGPGAVLLSQVTVAAGAEVGAGSILHPGVRIGENCSIGHGCILHHNASVGADGFGFVSPDEDGIERARKTGQVTPFNFDILRIDSLGNVIVGDAVEIGAGACIDRGTLGPTRIGDGTKIDNLVHIGHNGTIGENALIAGQVGFAGSVTVGDRVVIGGQAGIADHKTISDDAMIAAKAGVISDIEPKAVYAGYFARPIRQVWAQERDKLRIGKAVREIRRLRQRVDRLEQDAEEPRGEPDDAGRATAGSKGNPRKA
ncbi:MAG: UDP-3-O-(3-hydroxymyristoyl)glucosamine N-acyltransferase [Rhodospirillaceae bacterium]|nr:UDP-3-O-(3-hydroxymyristoyl)glucosamine N-acyltransferase [Rhodospirillaceae bacterium]